MENYDFDVSVIVIMYNSDKRKLFQTLDSILVQINISFEVIICDDGSKIRLDKEILSYFSTKYFNAYSLIFHDLNNGTVSNCCSGLEKAKGKYTKIISPGDSFANESALYEWIKYLERQRLQWSFSDSYFYYYGKEGRKIISKRAVPQIIYPYINNQQEKSRWNYLVLGDIPVGAAILGTTQIQLTYCKILKEKGVCYAEDNAYRLMMFDGIVGGYYSKPTIYYEYGTGISTSKEKLWKKRLLIDKKITYHIMSEKDNLSSFQKTLIKAESCNNMIGKFFVRGKLFHCVKWHLFQRLTPIP